MMLMLKGWRLMNELTQVDVAKRMDPPVHENTIAKWEKEPSKIPLGKFVQLCEIYGISTKDVDFENMK